MDDRGSHAENDGRGAVVQKVSKDRAELIGLQRLVKEGKPAGDAVLWVVGPGRAKGRRPEAEVDQAFLHFSPVEVRFPRETELIRYPEETSTGNQVKNGAGGGDGHPKGQGLGPGNPGMGRHSSVVRRKPLTRSNDGH